MILGAWVEAVKGVAGAPKQQNGKWIWTPTEFDPQYAENAVRLLRQAIGQKRFTMYGREQGIEWLGILGEPVTFAGSWIALRQMAACPIPNLWQTRDVTTRLIAVARRRAEQEKSDPETAAPERDAYGILHDLQTLGARLALSEPNLLTVMIGVSIIGSATEEGAGILNDAGRPEDAARLLGRGWNLMRPRLLASLMTMDNLDSLQADSPELRERMLGNDPKLLAEAKRLLALRRNAPGRDRWLRTDTNGNDVTRSGVLLADMIPNLDTTVPWTSPVITRDELETASRFETWGWQTFLMAGALLLACLALLIGLILYQVHLRTLRPDASRWPSPRRIMGAAVLFGVLAAGPGLAAAGAGNFLWELAGRFWNWHLFWIAWGPLAGAWALLYVIRRRPETAGRSKKAEYGLWISLAGLAAAPVCAFLAYSGTVPHETATPLLGLGKRASLGDFCPFLVMLLPFLGCVVVAVWRWLRACRRRDGSRAAPVAGLRLFLAGCAGGIVLWAASCWLADGRERQWGERDTLLTPRLAAVGFSPVEERVVRMYEEHIKGALVQSQD